jgi:hypothetical protein
MLESGSGEYFQDLLVTHAASKLQRVQVPQRRHGEYILSNFTVKIVAAKLPKGSGITVFSPVLNPKPLLANSACSALTGYKARTSEVLIPVETGRGVTPPREVTRARLDASGLRTKEIVFRSTSCSQI